MQKNQQHMKKFHSNIPFAFNAINPTNLTVSNFGSEKNLKSETQIPYCTYSILVTINTYDHKQQLRKHIIGQPLDYLNLIQFHKKQSHKNRNKQRRLIKNERVHTDIQSNKKQCTKYDQIKCQSFDRKKRHNMNQALKKKFYISKSVVHRV